MTPVFGVERILYHITAADVCAKDGFYAMAGCATPKMIGDPWVHGFCGKHLADWLTRVQKNKEASRVCKSSCSTTIFVYLWMSFGDVWWITFAEFIDSSNDESNIIPWKTLQAVPVSGMINTNTRKPSTVNLPTGHGFILLRFETKQNFHFAHLGLWISLQHWRRNDLDHSKFCDETRFPWWSWNALRMFLFLHPPTA